ncbi:dUTP diphosphatase [Bacillus cereus]|nr:dUTP diphosphatase [Bacillus cereus]
MTKLKKKKNYYKAGELVTLKETKETVKVKDVNLTSYEATVTFKNGEEKVVKLWDIRKLPIRKDSHKDTVLFARVREDAIIPTKRDEDAGFDLYANLETARVVQEGEEQVHVRELLLPKGKPTLVPTGIATSMLPKYYMNLKHERGSTGKVGMNILSGVVDSGYRGEIFINIVPLYKDIVLTSAVTEVEEHENTILYPYNKAIAQATIEYVPPVRVKEISFEELKAIPSERGEGKLGSSGK